MALTRPKAAQIDFDVTNITDPLFRLNSGQALANDKDIGIVIERGSDTNTAIIWDESADEFAVINTTEDGTTAGNVTISSYANIRASAFYGDGSNLTGLSSSNSTETLTNKTINTASNTITIVEADISDLQSYLTSESDTLDTVTGRGATTTNTLSIGGATLTDTTAGSSAGPIIELKRDITGSDANYIGQLKFTADNDADQSTVFAKITGKILDASDGTEDGIIEFAHKKAGSNVITGRWRSDSLQLINGTTLFIGQTGNITFEGATDDSYETILTVTDPTADRTITFPNATGTVALTDSFTHFHSAPQTVTSAEETTNSSSTVAYTFSELSGAVHYTAFLNRTLMRASEYSVSGTTLTVNSGVLATDDQIEVTGFSV